MDNPANHTRPFNDTKDSGKKDDGENALHEQAVKSVKSQHGDSVVNNPNFKDLVKKAEDQIRGAIENNEGM